MPAKERKGIVVFIVSSLIIVLSLILLSITHIPIKTYLTSLFATDNQTAMMLGELFEIAHKILYIALWMLLVILIVRFFNSLIASTVLRKVGNAELASLLQNVVSIVIYVFVFVTIVKSQFQTDLTTVFAGGTILGVVLGLALQDTLGNLFAGLALQADQPFQIGDVINIPSKNATGVVESVSWRGVKIRTFQNKILLISNSVLGRELIEVAPKDNLNARLLHFDTIYVTSPAKVVRVVREVVRNVDNVSSKYRPLVRIKNLGENGIEWEIKYWLEDYSKYNDTDATIKMRIWYAFQREGIHFAYPTRKIYVEEEGEVSLTEESEEEIFDCLSQASIFAPLTSEELRNLVKSVHLKIYSPNEFITREGLEEDSMFVIFRGSVKVQVKEGDVQKTIAILQEGDFFGEMGLFTGEPRTASVVASEETKVLQIRKEAIKPLLDANPQLVEAFSKVIAERKIALANRPKTEKVEELAEEESKGLISAIKRFFGIN